MNDEAEDVTHRLLTLVPTRPPRSVDRRKVQTYLPAILTARKNGNSWARIADIVGMKPDALRKAVTHFVAIEYASAPKLDAKRRTGDPAPSVDPRSLSDAGPEQVPALSTRLAVPPSTHAGFRRKDARI